MTAPPAAPPGTTAARATLAADIGGTWTRLRTGGPGAPVERLRSPSRLNHPGRPVTELRADMVDMLCAAAPRGAAAALSFGAAIDHLTGTVYGSAPLWGAEAEPYDLGAELRRRRPDVAWSLVNDVTAALADFVVEHARHGTRRIGYLTISSGIALRVADLDSRRIPVDDRGLQGEVGHLPAMVTGAAPERTGLLCECGAPDHLASVASGPGIARVAARLGIDAGPGLPAWLPAALADGDPAARRLLELCVEPVANLLRTLWCLDPHLDLLGLGGGVVEGLGARYADELRRQLAAPASYADPGRDGAWLAERLVFCGPGAVDPLQGAERIGRWLPGIVR
ncbi:ROK family protein [Streptomyces globosus]|uniref:ROK family protein n=1 Tax=Streptomyces globosus TaxID=68209 RepID=A0A344U343_9ACTN|nr:ROK family protein [Streptomyces globosus]AXE25314.1 ROK family protein [Streptomyces globosus]